MVWDTRIGGTEGSDSRRSVGRPLSVSETGGKSTGGRSDLHSFRTRTGYQGSGTVGVADRDINGGRLGPGCRRDSLTVRGWDCLYHRSDSPGYRQVPLWKGVGIVYDRSDRDVRGYESRRRGSSVAGVDKEVGVEGRGRRVDSL